MDKWPIGVFASIDAGLGVRLEVAHELEIPTVQLHAPKKETRTARQAQAFLEDLAVNRMTLTAVFGGFDGESYADIPTVAKTVGLVPEETRPSRTREMKEIADFTRLLGIDVVALHLGFVPHDPTEPVYNDILDVTRELCDHCAGLNQRLHLETGQEPADVLLRFITDVRRDNLFEAFTARTPSGPKSRARSGAAKFPWARATLTSNGSSPHLRKSATRARLPSSGKSPKNRRGKKKKSA